MTSQIPTSPPGTREVNKNLSILGLIIVLFSYWLFAWYLERIDFSTASWWVTRVETFPLLDTIAPLILFMMEMVSPRVLRHFIPMVVGWWLAYSLTVGLVQILYGLGNRADASAFLARLQSNDASREPAILISRRNFIEGQQQWPLLRVGGPGRITVDNGEALVTEQNGRFRRILGPGTHVLNRFEKIRTILDLRPQEQDEADIRLVTRDGIELKTEIGVTFRILPGEDPPTRARPFPFDRDAARRAAYNERVLPDGVVSTWESVALRTTVSKLQSIVAEYRLDDLIHPENPPAQPHQAIKKEVEEKARAAVVDSGVDLMDIRIGRLETPPPVTDQRIRYWQAYWEKQRRLSQADGEAEALTEMEFARAQAEATMIEAIVNGIEQVRQEGNAASVREIVAFRLIESLEKIAHQTQQTAQLPGELLPQLRRLTQELAPNSREAPTLAANTSEEQDRLSD